MADRDHPDGIASETLRPSPEAVRNRALAMAALVHRAMIEVAPPGDEEEKDAALDLTLAWVQRHSPIMHAIEPHEGALMFAARGQVARQQAIDASWRSEGLLILCWALSWLENTDLPPHDVQVEPSKLFAVTGLHDEPPLPAPSRIRADDEVEWLAGRLFGIHWRLRQYIHVRQEAVNLRRLSSEASFMRFEVAGMPLINDDLAIDGRSISGYAAADLHPYLSIATERHQAISWLEQGGVYSDVRTDT